MTSTRTGDGPAPRGPARPPHHIDQGAAGALKPGSLSGWAAVGVIVVCGALGGIADLITDAGLGSLFGAGLLIGCGIAAVLVRWPDKLFPIFAPPLVYGSVAVLGAVKFARDAGKPSLGVDMLSETILRLIDPDKAPWLIAATALAVLVIVVRRLQQR